MKILFVCTTEFQLLTALNMTFHTYKDDTVDIIADNYHGEEKALAERIRETGLFRHVCYFDTHIEQRTLHAFLRSISDGTNAVGVSEALKNSARFIWSRIKSLINGDKGYLSALVNGFSNLDITEYDVFCAYGGKPATRRMRSYVQNINPECKIIQLDEGVGSYYEPNVGQNGNVDGSILYNPDSSQLQIKTKQMPKMEKTDKAFIDMVNKVFEFDSSKCIDFCNSIIFFDQGVYNPMPKYLRNPSLLKRIIFHNSYRRHKIEAADYEQWKKITSEILAALNGKEIWIKPHPRSSPKAMDIYAEIPNIKVMPQYGMPWELIALNCNVEDSIMMTNVSSSVCLYPSVVQPLNNIRNVLIYKLYGTDLPENFSIYVENLCKKYPDAVFVPKDKTELVELVESK